MAPIEAPQMAAQVEFNERRWQELVADPTLADYPGKVETDQYGQLLMSPPPAFRHVRLQNKITNLLQNLLPDGEALTDCPVSTPGGVRVPDSAWLSKTTLAEVGNRVCLPKSPEICVEVLSPDNTELQIKKKSGLYFQAGAKEVWICDKFGAMSFYDGSTEKPLGESKLCHLFPTQITLD
jgi:Uma2 family endonuclease